jgi:hypothetical protein
MVTSGGSPSTSGSITPASSVKSKREPGSTPSHADFSLKSAR